MDRREAAARAAYTYWASRAGTLSASRLRDIPAWETIQSQGQ